MFSFSPPPPAITFKNRTAVDLGFFLKELQVPGVCVSVQCCSRDVSREVSQHPESTSSSLHT